MKGNYYLRTLPDPILRQPCVEVNDFSDLSNLLSNMFNIMVAEGGIGIAAPQVGDNRRISIARIDGQVREFINPKKLWEGEFNTSRLEGCLSIPNPDIPTESLRVEVPRKHSIRIGYQDIQGLYHVETFYGVPARILQHEMDHINEKLIIDYVKPES